MPTTTTNTATTATAIINNDTTREYDILRIGSLATTRRACREERMRQEDDYVATVQYARFHWEMIEEGEEERLVFCNDDGEAVVLFRSIPYSREFDDTIISGTASTAVGASATVDASTTVATAADVLSTTDTTTTAEDVMSTTDATATAADVSTTHTTATAARDAFSLLGTDWQAIEIIGYNDSYAELQQLQPALEGHPITLSFDDQGRIGGASGCNSYGGEVRMNTTDTTFTVPGPLMSTEMYCFGEGVMEQEYAYHRIFEQNETIFYYEVIEEEENGTELVLWSFRKDETEGEFQLVAIFASLVPSERRLPGGHPGEQQPALMNTTDTEDIAIIVGTEWTATEFAVSSSTIEIHHVLHQDRPITIGFESSAKIYGMAGCNTYISLRATVSADRLDVGDVATTRMMCPEDDVMEQEREYVALLSERSFFYRVLTHTEGQDELVLSEVKSSEDGSEVEGQVLARFVKSDSVLTSLGEMSEPVERTLETDVKKKGGLFNAYQTTPVHQGYGTHFATMWVGTPPQRKSVIIDTGSHFTAFPCKGCINCGEEHHTDAYFDPDESSTFHALTCGECQSASCAQGKCMFSQSCK